MSNELVTLSVEQYPVLAGGGDVARTIRHNLGGEQVTPGDLSRIKVPSGGATNWSVTGPDGEEAAVKTLEGIIVHTSRRRAYWDNPNPTGDPPACSSVDCLQGIGDPGGDCDSCQFNQFGSAVKPDGTAGRGKACKESRLVFLLRQGATLPEVVAVPAGSLKPVKQYLLKLGMPYWAVITRLSLTRTQNKDGIAFAQIAPAMIGVLDPEASKAIMAYAQELQAVFMAVGVDHSEVAGE